MKDDCTNPQGHCWHTGSGADSASYTTGGGHTITHYMCCFCGKTKREEHRWKYPVPKPELHGKHSWTEARNTFDRIARQQTER